jgi:hypothetical protein
MMKRLKAFICLSLALGGMAISEGAMAQRHGRYGGGHANFGIYLGGPLYGPAFYPPGYYYRPYYPGYYPPAVVLPSGPTVYIENAAPTPVPGQPPVPAQPPGQWWYYCQDSQAYYPNVAQCASPWQLVAPQPPNG